MIRVSGKSGLDARDFYCICHPSLPSGGELLNYGLRDTVEGCIGW